MKILNNNFTSMLKNIMIRRTQLNSAQSTTETISTAKTETTSTEPAFSPIVLGLHVPQDITEAHAAQSTTQNALPSNISSEQAMEAIYQTGLLNQINELENAASLTDNGGTPVPFLSEQEVNSFQKQICEEFFGQARMVGIAEKSIVLTDQTNSRSETLTPEAARSAIWGTGVYSHASTSDRLFHYCLDFCSHTPDLSQTVLVSFHSGLLQAEHHFDEPLPQLCYNTYKTTVTKFKQWAETTKASGAYL